MDFNKVVGLSDEGNKDSYRSAECVKWQHVGKGIVFLNVVGTEENWWDEGNNERLEVF